MQTYQEQRDRRGAERYEQYRLFEEKTDIGERLSLPIENHLTLEVYDGAVYGRTLEGGLRRMTEWSREALDAAMGDPGFSGVNAVERTRRGHEYDEAVRVETLSPGEAMVVFSPIPDDALVGRLSIQGYRTDLARTFCRLYYREPNRVRAITLTLERSDKLALQAAADRIGWDLPASLSSEEILARRHVMAVDSAGFLDLADRVRLAYDESLFERTGKVFFAGNPLAGRQDSMRFIDDNHDIIDEHMAVLRSIEARYITGAQRDFELESLRQRTAAALDFRLHGGTVISIADADVGVRMATYEYGGECATGVQTSTTEQMGLAQGKHVTNCPLCGTRGVTATVSGETITCSDCRGSVDICSGKVTYGRPTNRQQHERVTSTPPPAIPKKQPSTEKLLTARYGEKVTIKRHRVIGGEERLVVNARGDVLEKTV